jgi:hypothetical protein
MPYSKILITFRNDLGQVNDMEDRERESKISLGKRCNGKKERRWTRH